MSKGTLTIRLWPAWAGDGRPPLKWLSSRPRNQLENGFAEMLLVVLSGFENEEIKKEERNFVILMAVCLQFYKCFMFLLYWFCLCAGKNYVICNRFEIVQGKSIFCQMSVFYLWHICYILGMNKDCFCIKHKYSFSPLLKIRATLPVNITAVVRVWSHSVLL